MVLYGRTSQKFAKNFRSMRSLLVCFILSLWFMDGFAKQVTLAWDANTERNAAGYRLYYGLSSRAYTSIRDVGDQTSYTLSDLEEDKTYYFAVTAYNFKQTVESDFSNEVNTSGNNGVRSASQESPSAGSYESGIGIIRGWACNASTIEVEIDDGERMKAAYGTQREDTGSVCGRTDTGYGLTYNWNRLGDGETPPPPPPPITAWRTQIPWFSQIAFLPWSLLKKVRARGLMRVGSGLSGAGRVTHRRLKSRLMVASG
ncbi:MAG: fibronectin type III domain-containing protein [Candidatus Competibacteraceae bacterium]|nr:fibronectin type III domain-containing protein [Candidatus Competibacteraceae bacterium]